MLVRFGGPDSYFCLGKSATFSTAGVFELTETKQENTGITLVDRKGYSQHLQYPDLIKSSAKDLSPSKFEITINHRSL